MGQDSQLQVFTAELASEQIAKEAIEKLKQEYSGLVIKGVDERFYMKLIYWQKTCSNDL